ncbi:MAG: electron transport complex subunit RsxC [Spirochaetaceae bacterium]
MIFAKTFSRGGVHPFDRKEETRSREIWNAVIPSECIVPLRQHIGAPAECVVSKGDEVREGMLIGKANGFVSANVHAPVPGTVSDVRTIILPNGAQSEAVVIELAGEFDRLGKSSEPREWEDLSPKELIGILQEKGIVGMGGATFPTHVKYSVPKGKTAEYLIANGTECEPYLSADHRVMLEMTDGVLEGLRIGSRILGVKSVLIGIEDNKPDAIERFRSRIRARGLDFTVVPLEERYPQGGEKQLIETITGREVPSGGLPIDIGVIVSNTGTLHAMYEAVVYDKPLIDRVVTVSGGAVRRPANYKARIGTTIGELLEESGGFTEVPSKIVSGGPMTGQAVYDLDTPITKGTSGILALTAREVNEAPQTPCINCGRCVRSCPAGLIPTLLYKLIEHEDYKEAVTLGINDCIECGACGYICPAHIPLVQGIRTGKRIARKKKVTA